MTSRILLSTLFILLLGSLNAQTILGDCNSGSADFRYSYSGCCVTFYQCNSGGFQSWNYGDGTPTSSSSTHCYSSTGSYLVTHYFNGISHSEWIYVSGSCCVNDLTANFTGQVTPLPFFNLKAASFTDLSTSSDNIVSWDWTIYVYNTCTQSWQISNSTLQNPTAYFISAPSCGYQVEACLEVTDDCGEKDLYCRAIVALTLSEEESYDRMMNDKKENQGGLQRPLDLQETPLNQGLVNIKTYPNPALSNETLHVQIPFLNTLTPEAFASVQVAIFRADGKQIDQINLEQTSTIEIPLTGYEPGLYILNLSDNGRALTSKKFIVKTTR